MARKRDQPIPNSLIASATKVSFSDSAWRAYRLKDQQWQTESWRMYDTIGEFRFAANYVGSAVSRVRMYVAEVDPLGRIGEEIDSDDEIEAIADTLFGDRAAKSEQFRAMGIGLTVAGEVFLVGRAATGDKVADRDRWFVLAPSELKRQSGKITFRHNGEQVNLTPGRDIVIRLWTPHPARPDFADSPARSALPILVEMERLTQYVFSQLDSRLVGAGILPIPNNLEFPAGDDQPPGAEGLMQAILEAGEASIQGQGTASAVVPIMVEMPVEAIAAMKDKPITFESALSEHAMQMRQEAVRRLATTMDMPAEILEGAAETNHWGMWYVEENAIKIHVEPLVIRIIDGLNQAYLRPAIQALGRDPAKFTFWYDTSPLVNRPNKLQDSVNLYERGIVSRKTVLVAGDYNPEVDAPDQDEENIRFIKELMLREPTLFATPALREAIGIHIDTAPEEIEPSGPPPPPAPERAVEQDTSPTPELPSRTQPANSSDDGSMLAGAQLVPGPSPLLVISDIVVTEALRRVGKKLLGSRDLRGLYRDLPEEEIHTKLSIQDQVQVERLLEGAWDRLARYTALVQVDTTALASALHTYTSGLLKESVRHDRSTLRMILRSGGFAT